MLKKLIRYFIIGATFVFIFISFKQHWHDIISVRFSPRVWLYLSLSLLITCIAHVWSGYVWKFILKIFEYSLPLKIILKIYLVTNLYKYLPGNIGHLYARIKAISSYDVPLEIASISVLLEPLLMACSALSISIISNQLGLIKSENFNLFTLALLFLLLITFHPKFLNRIIVTLKQMGKKQQNSAITVKSYPILPLLGEMVFLLLRGAGFILIWLSFNNGGEVLPLMSAFSFAWLLGLVVPGAPGGLGVFEATMIALLDGPLFPPGAVLLSVSFYRVISILAEVLGAGLGLLCGKFERI